MGQILTTDVVAPSERLGYWVDLICQTYVELECDAAAESPFEGSIVSHRLPGLELSTVRSRAQRVLRTPRVISRSTHDDFIISVQTKGRGLISQDGRHAEMSPGDFALYDSTRPYTLRFDGEFEEIVLKLRGDQLRSRVRGTENLTATTVPGRSGAGHLMASLCCTLRDEIDTLSAASAASMADALVNVLVGGLCSLPACDTVDPSSLHAFHRERIKRRIDERLRDPTLRIESVAGELGMSVGHLHRVFKAEPLSAAQYLLARRLDACGRELLDVRRAKASVAEIAFGWGFNDAAHFSRVFRQHFDCSPREWRRQASAPGPRAQDHRSSASGRASARKS